MKSKLYYVLYFLYAIVVAFVLYLNGVFTGEWGSYTNLAINIGFLIIIGIIFVISSVSFGRLNRVTYELEDVMLRLLKEYKEADGKNLWKNYKDNAKVFEEKELQDAFNKYRLRLKRARRGTDASCDLGEYINEELLDREKPDCAYIAVKANEPVQVAELPRGHYGLKFLAAPQMDAEYGGGRGFTLPEGTQHFYVVGLGDAIELASYTLDHIWDKAAVNMTV